MTLLARTLKLNICFQSQKRNQHQTVQKIVLPAVTPVSLVFESSHKERNQIGGRPGVAIPVAEHGKT